jgi:hypothetical protein
MIKLTEIVKEISFQKGQAGSDSVEDLSSRALSQSDIDTDLDRLGDYNELEISTSDPAFVKAIKKKFDVVGQSQNFKLLKSKKLDYDQIAYYLIDSNAKKIGEYFIGVIKTELNTGDFYNLKKGFGVEVETVHWSNIGIEMKGAGLGKLMYTLVYDYVKSKGRALGSDHMLFEGSAGMWMIYMPSIAKYFGVIINDIMIPISREELTKKNQPVFGGFGVDGFIAMETPPPMVRKIAYNVKGLSFINGDYSIVTMYGNVNDKLDVTQNNLTSDKQEFSTFADYVNNFDTLKELMKSPLQYNILNVIGSEKMKYRTLIFAFKDAVLVVKQLPNGLSITPL